MGKKGKDMSQRSFLVKACWDDEAKVFVSQSDIIGLHIEAETLDEFERVLLEEGPALIVENHISRRELGSRSLRDLIPGIVFRPPGDALACA